MNMIFLVDGDNHLAEGLKGIDLLSADDTVLIFYGKGQSEQSVRKLIGKTQADVQLLESVRSGRNSIDFQIITELGVLIGRGEAEYAYVISQDKGYESAMKALRCRYSEKFQEVALRSSIEGCLQAAFLLRPQDKNELARSLEKTYGQDRGMVIYRHLKALFAPAVVVEEEEEPETIEPVIPELLKRRKKQKKAAPVVEEEPFVVLEGLEDEDDEEDEELLKPKKRTHRGGRRHHKRPAL